MAHMKRSRTTSSHSTGRTLCYFAITPFLMVQFLIGYLIFGLGSILIRCALLALFTGSRLVRASKQLARSMESESKEPKLLTHSVKDERTSHPKN